MNTTKHGRGRPAALALLTLGAGLTLGLGLPGAPARAQAPANALTPTPAGTFRLAGHVPGLAKTATLTGRLPSAQAIHLGLALPLRDPDGLADLITHLYTPGDPLYGHYLTSAQSTAQFGPTQADYDAVQGWATAHGLTVTHAFSNRQLLDVSGPASAVEGVFSLHLLSYQGADGRAFFAPDQDPAVPAALRGRLSGVIGLDDANPPHPANLIHQADTGLPGVSPALTPDFGNGPGGGLTPANIKTAYNLNAVPQTGAGQTLAVFEYDRYTASDITAYENQYGLPHVTLQNVGVDGYDTTAAPGGNADEVTLDIEMQIALAPGMTKLQVYEGSNGVDMFNQIASDNTAKSISTSWGGTEPSSKVSYINSENTAFSLMASQGQTIFAASGDQAAYQGIDGNNQATILAVQDPASQPYMTGVGGTTLSINSDGTYASETAWNDPNQHYQYTGGPYLPHGTGGGGGISGIWSIPSYQVGFVSSASKGSTSNRNVPDVSLDSDPNTGYSVYYNGEWTDFGGTSAAAPLWAGFTAVVNQMRVANGLPTLGFANPALYDLAGGPDYHLAFHDVADGSTNAYYPAVSGYDDATGLGTFNGANLFSFLTGLYADEGYGGTQLGTLPNPYATITNAVNNAPSTPVNLYIEGGSYGENLTISKPVTLINYGNGLVTIGT